MAHFFAFYYVFIYRLLFPILPFSLLRSSYCTPIPYSTPTIRPVTTPKLVCTVIHPHNKPSLYLEARAGLRTSCPKLNFFKKKTTTTKTTTTKTTTTKTITTKTTKTTTTTTMTTTTKTTTTMVVIWTFMTMTLGMTMTSNSSAPVARIWQIRTVGRWVM